MSRKILGLDVRNDAVSAVLINSSLRESRVESLAHIPISESEDMNSAFAYALEIITNQINISGAVCVASFPCEDISYRNITIPFKGQKKIAQILPFELEPMLPLSVEDMIMDFHTIKLSDQDQNTELIVTAVKKDSLKSYLKCLKQYKLSPKIITPGGYCTALCMNQLQNMPKNWILLDISQQWYNLFLIISNQLYLIRSFPIGSKEKKGYLANTIHQTLTAFKENSNLDFEIQKLFITGHALTNLSADQEGELEKILEIPVVRVDLLSNSNIKIKPAQRLNWKSDKMDNAFALALAELEGISRLNFRKGPFATKKNWETHKKNLITSGIFSLIILIFIFFNFMVESYGLQKKIDKLDAQIIEIFKTTFPDVKKIVNPLHQMQVAMDEIKKNTFTPVDSEKNIRIIDILNEFSQKIPKDIDVEFTRLVAGQENILISGNTDTFNSVDTIQTKLEKSELFQKVTINSTKKDKTENRVQFKMKVDL